MRTPVTILTAVLAVLIALACTRAGEKKPTPPAPVMVITNMATLTDAVICLNTNPVAVLDLIPLNRRLLSFAMKAFPRPSTGSSSTNKEASSP